MKLVIAGGFVITQFHAVEGGGGGEGVAAIFGQDAVLAGGIGLVDGDGKQRIAAQVGMVIEVLVAEGQSVEALRNQADEGMLDEARITLVAETGGEFSADALVLPELSSGAGRCDAGGQRRGVRVVAGGQEHDMAPARGT